MSQEIELYSKLQNPIEAIDRLGEMFAKSGMFGCERVEQGKILAMICLVERKSPVAITTNYDIVEGKLRKKALAALADFRTLGGKHRWVRSGDEPAAKEEDRYAELQLTDRAGETTTYRYSMADARAEGLIRPRSRWEKRPGNMLRARCISNGLGMLCPEIFAGEDEPAETGTGPKPLLPERDPSPQPPPVVDVKAEVMPEAAPTPNLQPEPSTAVSSAQERVLKVEAVIGRHADKALAWLTQRGWITKSLLDLSEDRATRILARPQEFLKAVGAV